MFAWLVCSVLEALVPWGLPSYVQCDAHHHISSLKWGVWIGYRFVMSLILLSLVRVVTNRTKLVVKTGKTLWVLFSALLVLTCDCPWYGKILLLWVLGDTFYSRDDANLLAVTLLSRAGQKLMFSSDKARHTIQSVIDGVEDEDDESYKDKAARIARTAVEQLDGQAYMMEMSMKEQKQDLHGSRHIYWPQDWEYMLQEDDAKPNSIPVLIDVDYYMDIDKVFHKFKGRPVMLYTFQPSSVARNEKEASFTFDALNQVTFVTRGGDTYTHQVWNHNVMSATSVKRSFLGLPICYQAYSVVRTTLRKDHDLVMYVPSACFTGIWAMLALWLYGEKPVKRLRVVEGDYLRMKVRTPTGIVVSTGAVNSMLSIDIDARTDDVIRLVTQTSKHDVALSQVMGFMKKPDSAEEALEEKLKAVMLHSYHRQNGTDYASAPMMVPREIAVRGYQYGDYEPEAKPGMEAFMNALSDNGFSPELTLGNELKAIQGRITKVASPVIEITPSLSNLMDEFVNMLIPNEKAGTCIPAELDEVLERQNKPSQRYNLAAGEGTYPDHVIRSFMKREAYANVKDPRVISTYNSADKREYSRVIYGLEPLFKQQEWYAFSRTPKEIAGRVAMLLSEAKTAVNTDFSRFDGHVSNVVRELEARVIKRAYGGAYTEPALGLHSVQYDCKAFMTHGTKYESGYSRGSGSPETSLFNSMTNAFVAFSAITKQSPDKPLKWRWERLGLYGGDDGLTPDVTPEHCSLAAKEIGQDLTTEPVNRGELGIKFLARHYSPYVWNGDANSMCDVKRQLDKFHITVNLGTVSPTTRLLEKIRGYALSDWETPIMGDLCRQVTWLNGNEIAKPNDATSLMRSWNCHFEVDEQYPNTYGDWMWAVVARDYDTFNCEGFRSWLHGCNTLDDILNAPCFNAPRDIETKDFAHVRGEPVNLEMKEPEPPPPSEKKKNKKFSLPSDSKLEEKKEDRELLHRPNGTKTLRRPKESFETMKARKIANGTWKEEGPRKRKPPAKDAGGSAP